MKGNYGIDAPKVVINLFLFSFILMVIAVFSFYIPHKIWFWVVFLYSLSTSLTLLIMGFWMVYGIKIAKPQIIQKMIHSLELKGNEKFLILVVEEDLFYAQLRNTFLMVKLMGLICGYQKINQETLQQKL